MIKKVSHAEKIMLSGTECDARRAPLAHQRRERERERKRERERDTVGDGDGKNKQRASGEWEDELWMKSASCVVAGQRGTSWWQVPVRMKRTLRAGLVMRSQWMTSRRALEQRKSIPVNTEWRAITWEWTRLCAAASQIWSIKSAHLSIPCTMQTPFMALLGEV